MYHGETASMKFQPNKVTLWSGYITKRSQRANTTMLGTANVARREDCKTPLFGNPLFAKLPKKVVKQTYWINFSFQPAKVICIQKIISTNLYGPVLILKVFFPQSECWNIF
jgi:hypothetical protein